MTQCTSIRQVTTNEDCRVFAEVFADPEYLALGILSKHISVAAVLKSTLASIGKLDQMLYLCLVDDEPVAAVHLSGIDRVSRNAEIHVAARRVVWGSAVAAALARELLGVIFDDLGLHRVFGLTPSWNKKLVQLALLLGARVEGYVERGWYSDGNWHTTCAFGLLSSEALYRRRFANVPVSGN